MSEPAAEPTEKAAEAAPAQKPRRRRRVLAVLGLLVVVLLALLWWQRENLAHRIIAGQLETYDLPASYRLEQVGPLRQVLTGVVVGNPARPDFTAERIDVQIEPTFGLPTIGKVTLVRPRLYGSVAEGKLSFGSLDKALFTPSEGSPGLPDLELNLIDGRARIDSPQGAVGIKLDGRGNLRSGFAGQLAAIAPDLRLGDCRASRLSAFGQVTSLDGKPSFKGPLRLENLSCAGVAARSLALAADLSAAADFASLRAAGKLSGGPLDLAGQRAGSLGGEIDLALRGNDATARYRLKAQPLLGELAARELAIEGVLRSRDSFARMESEGTLSGQGLQPGSGLDRSLADLERGAAGTLAQPLLAQLRSGLKREGAGSRLAASYTLRQSGALSSLVLPKAEWIGTSGQTLAVLSRGQLAFGGQGGLRLSGNLRTGGAGLPRLTGQIERRPGGVIEARLAMAEYRARDASLAFPQLVVIRRANGAIGFSGRALASGTLPGGQVSGLDLPLDGIWTPRGGLRAGRTCTPVKFRSLRFAELTLDARSLTLCPSRGEAILASDRRGTRIAAGVPALALAGRLGNTPVRLSSGAVGLAWPGSLNASKVDVALGDPTDPNRFTIAELKAQLGSSISGTFAGAEARLAAVPLDILNAEGNWSYANGRLLLSEGTFRLEDRPVDDRFEPLIARGASLVLADNRISASAALREPRSDRLVTEALISHDLGNGLGWADLAVPGVNFDEGLQPTDITNLALGVIANAEGTVSGSGRIDWSATGVTSTGRFGTEKFNFAAAFGPVEGVSGTMVFTDLLGLVTAPDQRLKIASINAGIEVYEGELSFQLEPDGLLVVNGAEWPFVDGQLQLLPTRMKLGASDVRLFTLRVIGANAAEFVQQLELSNINARGVFDGELPLVFDENGGRIVGGQLTSRPPGGNLSYVGELTYKDMGAMANFAFQSLRSLDFKRMEIGLGGELDGEIFSQLRFDGVTQGEGAKRNFLTRQVGRLPIRFNINIRAPFQGVLGSFRSLYDPSYVRDPRELGLIDAQGRPIEQPSLPVPLPPDIQPPVSRNNP